jgi:hypothetical protein
MSRFSVLASLLAALAISLAIFVPLTGVLVRLRANYNPKGLQLDSERDAVPHTGPVVRSYFKMMGRVYRIEVRSRALSSSPTIDRYRPGLARILQRIKLVTLLCHIPHK